MLIDSAYFYGELTIANANQPQIKSVVDSFISQYEPEFLKMVLGYKLYTDFIAGWDGVVNPDQKWEDLAKGADYTLNGETKHWQGFLLTGQKKSCITNYVYYWYMRYAHTQTTSVGEQKNKVENSDTVTPAWKMSTAWFKMRQWVADMCDFLVANKGTYGYTLNKHEVLRDLGTVNEYSI